MSLSYTLDWAAFQISKEAKGENALVRKRVAKLCKDIRDLRPFVENLPVPHDFIGVCDSDEFLRRYKRKRYCSVCHKDITLVGGWTFPQEPGKLYCLDCEDKKFRENLERKGNKGGERR